jgi:hypothetical protein
LGTFGIGASHDDVLDQRWIYARSIDHRAKHQRREVVGPKILKRAFMGERKGSAGEARNDSFVHIAIQLYITDVMSSRSDPYSRSVRHQH